MGKIKKFKFLWNELYPGINFTKYNKETKITVSEIRIRPIPIKPLLVYSIIEQCYSLN